MNNGGRKCQIEGCDGRGSFGFRKSGLLSEQKTVGYLWVCKDHIEEAEKRKAAAEGKTYDPT